MLCCNLVDIFFHDIVSHYYKEPSNIRTKCKKSLVSCECQQLNPQYGENNFSKVSWTLVGAQDPTVAIHYREMTLKSDSLPIVLCSPAIMILLGYHDFSHAASRNTITQFILQCSFSNVLFDQFIFTLIHSFIRLFYQLQYLFHKNMKGGY